jgi:pimeloyl-ACP methyl ester carboxylesterase
MAQATTSNARQGRYVQANDLRVYYEEQGSGEPLVLVGWGVRMWSDYMPGFAPHFRVLAADSRGRGKTDDPGGELSYRLLADDLAAFIERLGLHKPLVCGYSDGGQVVLELGMRYPAVARALVAGAAWKRFSDAYLEGFRQEGMQGPGVVDLQQAAQHMPGLIKTLTPSPDPDHWKTALRALSVLWLTPLDYTAEDLGRITAPTLLLVGDRDDQVPVEEAVEMVRLIPNAELAVAPGSTHGGLFDNEHLFTTLVLDFLLRHST